MKGVDSYIAVDIETTGLSPRKDKIIEIAAVKVIGGEIINEYHEILNPQIAIPEKIQKLTGITEDMIKEKPLVGEIIEEFIEFCGTLPILGHNILFDYSFIKRAALNAGLEFEKEGIDTLFICRKLMPPDKKKQLSSACEYFDIKRKSAHRASEDARDVSLLYQRAAERYADQNKDLFNKKQLNCKIKKEQKASKRQKEHLRKILNYHKIVNEIDIDSLSKNEVSRISDRLILNYGKLKK